MKQVLSILLSIILGSFSPAIAETMGSPTCATAVAITLGDYQCDHTGGVDQWYSYTAPEEQKITVSSCGLTTQTTQLELYHTCSAIWAYGESCGTG
ncbi:MAG TPA: hypothetical protein VMV56_03635, partial [Williamwhitmania sp.]|nr:hypothetical protein [Williamwhitmania sp.]